MVPTCLGVKSRELEVPALVTSYMLVHLPGTWGLYMCVYIYIYIFFFLRANYTLGTVVCRGILGTLLNSESRVFILSNVSKQ